MGWIEDQVGVWLGLSGHVGGWSGVEMALWGDDGDGDAVFHDPDAPFLQLAHVEVVAGGRRLRIGIDQADLEFGISIRPLPEAEPPWEPDGSYRRRALPELPTGPLRSIEVRQEEADAVIAEVSLVIGDQQLLLVAGEVEPGWTGWRLLRLDESVLAFVDPLSAEGLAWEPPRPAAFHVSSSGELEAVVAPPAGGQDGGMIYERLRLAPEFGAGPVWDDDWDGEREICPEPGALGLSAGLAHDLVAWQREYDAILAPYPPDSAFPSAEAEERWRQQGVVLAERLQAEAGDRVVVRLAL